MATIVNGQAGSGPLTVPITDAVGVPKFEDLLRCQDGIVTRAQAIACGMSARTVSRRVADGAWRTLHPGVFLVGGHRLTDLARIRAAALWAAPTGTVSGPAAARWLGMTVALPGPVDVTIPRARRRSARPGVRVRHRDLDRADRTTSRGIAVTAPALTVLETAAVLDEGTAFLDRMLQRRRVRFDDLHAAYCRAAGARGMDRAGALLRECADRADSTAERRLAVLLRRAGITGFVLAHPFGRTPIDVAFPDAWLAIELDGWAWHTDPERFAADREKGNALVEAGWTLLRFTWRDLTERPDTVLARIRSALARAA